MAYRIVKFHPHKSGDKRASIEIGAYDSAYRAMRVMKDELHRRGSRPLNWYLLDPQGNILADPEDVVEASVA